MSDDEDRAAVVGRRVMQRIEDIKARTREINKAYPVGDMPPEKAAEWYLLQKERFALEALCGG